MVEDRLSRITKIAEKPKFENAPSTMEIAGSYILAPEIFNQIRQQSKGALGEIKLADGIANLLKTEHVHAYQYFGSVMTAVANLVSWRPL